MEPKKLKTLKEVKRFVKPTREETSSKPSRGNKHSARANRELSFADSFVAMSHKAVAAREGTTNTERVKEVTKNGKRGMPNRGSQLSEHSSVVETNRSEQRQNDFTRQTGRRQSK